MEFRERRQYEKIKMRVEMFELRLKHIEEVLLEHIVHVKDLESDLDLSCSDFEKTLTKSLSNGSVDKKIKSNI